jgi:hypothetical protein
MAFYALKNEFMEILLQQNKNTSAERYIGKGFWKNDFITAKKNF